MNFNINTFVHTSDSYLLELFQHKMYQSRCMAQNSWWWAERLPETCRVVIPIKLEFSASVGFIHKESVTMHGHTIVKLNKCLCENTIVQISVNVLDYWSDIINPVKNKNNLSCVYTFSVPRSKHSPSRLQTTITQYCTGKDFLFLPRSVQNLVSSCYDVNGQYHAEGKPRIQLGSILDCINLITSS